MSKSFYKNRVAIDTTISVTHKYYLFFIIRSPEIDDQFPRLLGLDQDAIIENYLLSEAMLAYEKYATLTDKDIGRAFRRADVSNSNTYRSTRKK